MKEIKNKKIKTVGRNKTEEEERGAGRESFIEGLYHNRPVCVFLCVCVKPRGATGTNTPGA